LPGEEVTFGDGHVFINGEQLPEDYIQDRTTCRPARSDNCDVVVPEGDVFVLGDHRSNSSDSRVFGPVPVGNIVGKAWFSYWPVNDVGFVPHESYTDTGTEPAAAAASPSP
jgi:signal peptidase I